MWIYGLFGNSTLYGCQLSSFGELNYFSFFGTSQVAQYNLGSPSESEHSILFEKNSMTIRIKYLGPLKQFKPQLFCPSCEIELKLTTAEDLLAPIANKINSCSLN